MICDQTPTVYHKNNIQIVLCLLCIVLFYPSIFGIVYGLGPIFRYNQDKYQHHVSF
jgi:hypothetical protein